MHDIRIEITAKLDIAELKGFYESHGCSLPQSVDKLSRMVENSVCFVTARDAEGKLVGIARGLADGVRGYLTECKLDPGLQGPGAVTQVDGRIEHDHYGIAREMAERVIHALADVGCERIDLTAYGTEADFCEELGFKRVAGIVPMSLNVRDRIPAATVGGLLRP